MTETKKHHQILYNQSMIMILNNLYNDFNTYYVNSNSSGPPPSIRADVFYAGNVDMEYLTPDEKKLLLHMSCKYLEEFELIKFKSLKNGIVLEPQLTFKGKNKLDILYEQEQFNKYLNSIVENNNMNEWLKKTLITSTTSGLASFINNLFS